MTRRIRALLIDEASVDASRILPALEGAGYELIRAFSAETVLTDLPRMQPNIILLVESTPPGTAAGIARRIRLTAAGRPIPILLLLADPGAVHLSDEDWQAAGCDAVLELPCSDRELVGAVDAVLGSRTARHSRLSLVADFAEVDTELESAMNDLDADAAEPHAEPEEPRHRPGDLLEPIPGHDLSDRIPAWGRAAGVPRTAEDVGWRPRGPDGIVESPLPRLGGFSEGLPPRRPVETDPGLRLRTIVTLGAGALLAGACVAFLVWLLVYTGFEGSENPPVRIEQAGDGSANAPKPEDDPSGHNLLESGGLGGDTGDEGTGDEAGGGSEGDSDEPGVNQLLLSPYSAAPPLVLPPRDAPEPSGDTPESSDEAAEGRGASESGASGSDEPDSGDDPPPPAPENAPGR